MEYDTIVGSVVVLPLGFANSNIRQIPLVVTAPPKRILVDVLALYGVMGESHARKGVAVYRGNI